MERVALSSPQTVPRFVPGALIACRFLFAALLVALGGAPAGADDPMTGITDTCTAPDVVLAKFEVRPAMSGEFMQAMLKSSHYHGQMPAMVQEVIAQSLSEPSAPSTAFSVISMHNAAHVAQLAKSRNGELASMLSKDPEYVTAKVVEHQLANWGLAKGREVVFQRVTPYDHGDPFAQYVTSLAFFKTGYLGQMSMLEQWKPGTTLEQVRADLLKRRGMSGASIYLDEATNTYYAFSQYFNLAVSDVSSSRVADRHVAQVVQSFRSR